MEIKSNEIHIWSGTLDITPAQEAKYFSVLTPAEQERANRFKFEKDKRHFITARYMLRQILSQYINELPENLVIDQSEHGKPYIAHSLLEFNLSHSAELAVYAICLEHALGIDIEKVQGFTHTGVVEKYFSPEEKNYLHQLSIDDQEREFYELWTRKEALIKAVGKGLFISLNKLNVLAPLPIVLEDEAWSLMPLSIHSNYAAALAYNPLIKDLSYFVYQHV